MRAGDQYPVKPPQVKTLPTGERVVVDRGLTLQYVYNVLYWFVLLVIDGQRTAD